MLIFRPSWRVRFCMRLKPSHMHSQRTIVAILYMLHKYCNYIHDSMLSKYSSLPLQAHFSAFFVFTVLFLEHSISLCVLSIAWCESQIKILSKFDQWPFQIMCLKLWNNIVNNGKIDEICHRIWLQMAWSNKQSTDTDRCTCKH